MVIYKKINNVVLLQNFLGELDVEVLYCLLVKKCGKHIPNLRFQKLHVSIQNSV